jgi:hypothetical protein
MKAFAIAGLILIATAGAAAAQSARSVMIGSDGPDAAACRAIGAVSGLNRRGDNFLSVRAGPHVRARELARLRPGRRIDVCDRTEDGRWLGIVYGKPGEDCGVDAPASRPQPYQAGWSCRSGWVAARYITIIAR